MRHVRRLAFAVVPLAVLAGLGLLAIVDYDRAHADVIARGVVVAGVDVGGMRADAARTKLRLHLHRDLGRPIVVVGGGARFVLRPKAAGLHVGIDRMVGAAVHISRRGNVFDRFYREWRHTRLDARVKLRVEYSKPALVSFAERVRRRVHRDATDAQVIPSATSLQIVPSKLGVAVRVVRLRRELAAALVQRNSRRLLRVPTAPLEAAVTTKNLPQKYPVFLTVCRNCFQLRLWLHLKLARVYPIAVGQQGLETPAGLYHINDRQVNPSWHVPKSAWAGDLAGRVIPPGPDDPLKARWLGFWNGAGIHGTADTWSLGSAASHGCIRMSIPDVIELYDKVPFGTPIYVG